MKICEINAFIEKGCQNMIAHISVNKIRILIYDQQLQTTFLSKKLNCAYPDKYAFESKKASSDFHYICIYMEKVRRFMKLNFYVIFSILCNFFQFEYTLPETLVFGKPLSLLKNIERRLFKFYNLTHRCLNQYNCTFFTTMQYSKELQ